MKNLKRALCLVLTCAMMLGLMIMTTSAADFTDKDKIVNTDAVDTMVALNIINGKDDGSYFDPTGIVTRAEMCKMICVALNGGKDPQLGTTAYSYTDTNGTWAAGYIEYCTNLGIVAGRGDGTFDPTGTVTGTEAAKMLLVAIGYDAAAEGFTGASWAVAVNVRANQKDFYEDLEGMDPSAGLTRDNAAQMVFNAINAVMVEYDYNLTTVGGQLSTVSKATDMDDDDTILVKKFNMTTEYGIITHISYDSDDEEYTYYVNNKDEDGITSFTSSKDYSSLYMMKTKILYKGNDTDKVYGVYAYDSSVLLSGIVNSLPTIGEDDTSFKYSDVSYKIDNGDIKVYDFNDGIVYYDDADVDTDLDNNALCTYERAATKPYSFSLIDIDDDNKGDLVVVYPFTVNYISYVGTSSITLLDGGSVDKDDLNLYEGIAKKDFVKIVAAANTLDNTPTLTKIDLLEGKVSSTKDANKSFKIDGTWYKIPDTSLQVDGSEATATAGKSYEKIAVVNGYAFNIAINDDAPDTSDYAVVVAATVGTDTIEGPQVKLLFSDGTKKVVAAATNYTTLVDTLVTYTVDDDEYTLKAATQGDFDEDYSDEDYKWVTGGKSTIGGCYIDANAVIFVQDEDDKWSVITGSELAKSADIEVDEAYANSNSSTGFDTIALACVYGETVSGDICYGYVTAAPEVVENDDDDLVYSVTFWNGTETVVANTTVKYDDHSLDGLADGTLIFFTYDGSEIDIDSVVVFAASNTSAVSAYNDDDEIKFVDDAQVYEINDDTVIIYIDAENTAKAEGGTIQLASDKNAAGDKYDNVFFDANSAHELTLLVVDVQNDILDAVD